MVNVGKYLPNYTGPYISNGKFQTSVKFGNSVPKDKLDKLSRLHDTAFSEFKDYGHRTAANVEYNNLASQGDFFSKVAGGAVLYGNQLISAVKNVHPGMSVPGLIYGGVRNALDLHDYLINKKKYRTDVLNLYKSDPRRGNSAFDPYATVPKTPVNVQDGGFAVAGLGIGGKRAATDYIDEPPPTGPPPAFGGKFADQNAADQGTGRVDASASTAGDVNSGARLYGSSGHGGGWGKINGGLLVRPRRKTRRRHS